MSTTPDLQPAYAALDDGMAALTKLDKTCCVPGRSPRMAALSEAIGAARAALDTHTAGGDAGAVTAALEAAGAQVGSLQIGCCAPSRLPLYSRILEDLTTVQLTIDRAQGHDH